MSSSGEIEPFRADVRDCHDQVALLRAKLYRWGVGSNPQLQELEQDLEHAEERLREAPARHSPVGPAGPSAAHDQ